MAGWGLVEGAAFNSHGTGIFQSHVTPPRRPDCCLLPGQVWHAQPIGRGRTQKAPHTCRLGEEFSCPQGGLGSQPSLPPCLFFFFFFLEVILPPAEPLQKLGISSPRCAVAQESMSSCHVSCHTRLFVLRLCIGKGAKSAKHLEEKRRGRERRERGREEIEEGGEEETEKAFSSPPPQATVLLPAQSFLCSCICPVSEDVYVCKACKCAMQSARKCLLSSCSLPLCSPPLLRQCQTPAHCPIGHCQLS